MGSRFVWLFVSWFVLAIIFLLGDKLYSWELRLQESTANTYRTFYKECSCWLLNQRGRQVHHANCSLQWFSLVAISLISLICLREIAHTLLIENLMLLIHSLDPGAKNQKETKSSDGWRKWPKAFSLVLEAGFELGPKRQRGALGQKC